MTSIYTQSSFYAESPNGRVKKAFQMMKGTNHMISQIKGVSNNIDPTIYHITSNMKRYNKSTGIIHSKHKSYRLKSSEMEKLLKNEEDETNEEENNEEENTKPKKVVKKVVKKAVKKVVKKDETSTSKAKKPKAKKLIVSGEKKKEVKKNKTSTSTLKKAEFK